MTQPTPATPEPTLVQLFQGWNLLRAVLHNGWWLVVSLYMVVDAHLSPAQLLTIAAAQGVVSVIFEIPAGALADTISRKWAIVVSHVLMGTAMIATGLTDTRRVGGSGGPGDADPRTGRGAP